MSDSVGDGFAKLTKPRAAETGHQDGNSSGYIDEYATFDTTICAVFVKQEHTRRQVGKPIQGGRERD